MHVVEELSLLPGYWLYPSVIGTSQVLDEAETQGRELLTACVAEAESAGIKAQFELFRCRENRVAQIIVRAAAEWGADLVVMGTHGRRGFNRLILGSDADLVIRGAPCPVLMLKCQAPPATAD
jgi:nucleotide-binding universal stress UspA family protein